jgi:hypothetical protein
MSWSGVFEQLVNVLLPLNFSYGAAFAALTLLPLTVFWLVSPASTLVNVDIWLGKYMPIFTGTLLLLTCGLALLYLAFPSYLDHVEATSAMLGRVLGEGGAIWPDLQTDFSYRGLLYGPGLAEVQWLATLLPVNPVLASKLPGVMSFLLAVFVVHNQLRHPAAKAYLLLLLPFGLLLFWTRAEPLFLLLVAATLTLNQRHELSWPLRALLMGMMMGAACTLKLHAGIYVLAAWCCTPVRRTWPELGLIGLAALGVFFLAFLPEATDLNSFLAYLKLASHHGLAAKMALKNALTALLIVLPVALGLIWREVPPPLRLAAWVFVGSAALVAMIGAKPGAGPHHLLPLVLIGASLINQVLVCTPEAAASRRGGYLVGVSYVAPSLVMVTMLSYSMLATWQDLGKARDEIQAIGVSTPDAVMGLPGWKGYRYTLLRAWMPASASTQVDFASYMDLQFAGVPDDQLQRALADCRVHHIVVPRGEQPFSMGNYYDMQPLMSATLRQTFLARYKVVSSGARYSLWQCKAA